MSVLRDIIYSTEDIIFIHKKWLIFGSGLVDWVVTFCQGGKCAIWTTHVRLKIQFIRK